MPAVTPRQKRVSKPKARRRYQILAMDGGPSTPNYLRWLREIERERPGFLASVDMFTGTSDGAWAALYLASRPRNERGDHAIAACIDFNQRVVKTLTPGLLGIARLMGGRQCAVDNGAVLQFLTDSYGHGSKGKPITLQELHADVAIIAFRIRATTLAPSARVYHNLGRYTFGDSQLEGTYVNSDDAQSIAPDASTLDANAGTNLHQDAAEVALRSGSFPVMMPIRSGYIDGGMFANNPSMAAVAQVLAYREPMGLTGLEDVTVMSLGSDQSQLGGQDDNIAFSNKKNPPWGWMQWMLQPRMPLLLLDTMMTASGRGIAFQAHQMLGAQHLRLALPCPGSFGRDFISLIDGHAESLFIDAEQQARRWVRPGDTDFFDPDFESTLGWIDERWSLQRSDWAPPNP
jgi:hypothetical protein